MGQQPKTCELKDDIRLMTKRDVERNIESPKAQNLMGRAPKRLLKPKLAMRCFLWLWPGCRGRSARSSADFGDNIPLLQRENRAGIMDFGNRMVYTYLSYYSYTQKNDLSLFIRVFWLSETRSGTMIKAIMNSSHVWVFV